MRNLSSLLVFLVLAGSGWSQSWLRGSPEVPPEPPAQLMPPKQPSIEVLLRLRHRGKPLSETFDRVPEVRIRHHPQFGKLPLPEVDRVDDGWLATGFRRGKYGIEVDVDDHLVDGDRPADCRRTCGLHTVQWFDVPVDGGTREFDVGTVFHLLEPEGFAMHGSREICSDEFVPSLAQPQTFRWAPDDRADHWMYSIVRRRCPGDGARPTANLDSGIVRGPEVLQLDLPPSHPGEYYQLLLEPRGPKGEQLGYLMHHRTDGSRWLGAVFQVEEE